MKKLVLTLALAVIAVGANAQSTAMNSYFEKYRDDTTFTYMNFGGKMFQMMANIELESEQDQELMEESLGKIKRIQVLRKENDVDGRAMYSSANKLVSGKDYEELMFLREKDNDIRFLIKEKDNKVDELLMIMGGSTEFALLSIVGDGIDLNALYKLSKSIGMDGFEELEFLDGKKG